MKKSASLGFKSDSLKGQSQIIGVVLLTLVMITMVGITYMWGMPMIEKQKDTIRISNMEKLMKELDDKIQEVAKNGGTQRIETPGITEEVSLIDRELNDRIELRTITTGVDIATDTDIYLRGNEENEVPIGNEAGVIKINATRINEFYDVEMDLYYRNLTGSESVYIIDLVGLGRDKISGENHIITISEGIEMPAVEENGVNVYTTKINVRFE